MCAETTPTIIPQKKRLCVLSDGTWNAPEYNNPSNIVKLTEAIRHAGDDGLPQLVLYDRGIGTAGMMDKLLGGAFGAGIDENIQQLYTFLSYNYNDGDEVYMFGFSRGAYTVRSLAGMINDCGLCRRQSLEHVKEAYGLYRRNLPNDHKDLKDFREQHGNKIDIDLVMCYDTVGSLGIPESAGWLNGLTRRQYEFHDTRLSEIIKNAIHVLSVDEDRSTLKPTFMNANDKVPNQLTQLFFWGSHGGVGGSELTEKDAGEVTLRFTVEEIKRRGLGLAFDDGRIKPYPNVVKSDPITAISNGLMSWFTPILGRYVRPVDSVKVVHQSAIDRYQGNDKWRPAALAKLKKALLDFKLSFDWLNQ